MAEYAKDMVILNELVKKFDDLTVVDRINLKVKEGEFMTFLGSSGCGKTTTLRMIAGFEEPTSGAILINSRHVYNLPPNKRDVNTVFQSYALFPHMNIYDNIAFGLKMKKMNKQLIKEKVGKVLDLVQLSGYEKRKANQLSGGQKQRIAIARALVNEPKVLLLDEPLGALDLKLRKQMQIELKHLQKKLGITFIYVTHDQEEALTMSDRIAIMNKGRIEQLGTAEEIYEQPATKFVADFIGETNLLSGKVITCGNDYAKVDMDGVKLQVSGENLSENQEISITLRPERIHLGEAEIKDKVTVQGRFKEAIYLGALIKLIYTLDNGEDIIVTKQIGDPSLTGYLTPEKPVTLSWDMYQAKVIRR